MSENRFNLAAVYSPIKLKIAGRRKPPVKATGWRTSLGHPGTEIHH